MNTATNCLGLMLWQCFWWYGASLLQKPLLFYENWI